MKPPLKNILFISYNEKNVNENSELKILLQ